MEELIRQIEALRFEMDLYLSFHNDSPGEVHDFLRRIRGLSAQVQIIAVDKPEEGPRLILYSQLIRSHSRMLRRISQLTVRTGHEQRKLRFPEEV